MANRMRPQSAYQAPVQQREDVNLLRNEMSAHYNQMLREKE